MTRKLIALSAASLAGFAFAVEPALRATVTVDPAKEIQPIKLMNSVNNGPTVPPVRGDQKRGNFSDYKLAKFPMARLHDSINCVSGGAHCVDVNAIFPDFDADENDPKNYDFVFTDHYLDAISRAGTKIFYRLGQTIEHGPKKYGALPPKDYAKWARICEHIIRHYNEGWGWGLDKERTTRNIEYRNQFKIEYWEIWNEPDLDEYNDIEKNTSPRCWGGTVTNFFNFYEIAAKHLKGKFPDLKIGGPAICGRLAWGKKFIKYCRDTNSPLDFFSWHTYSVQPSWPAQFAKQVRDELDANGFKETESILNEWNYVKGWGDDWVYTLEVESGRFNQKAAAFIAAVLTDCQKAPVDHLMFYDAKAGSGMNCLFDKTTLWPTKGYYPFICWNKLLDAGTQVDSSVKQYRPAPNPNAPATGVVFDTVTEVTKGQFRSVAAKGADGSVVVFITRFVENNNETDTATVSLSIADRIMEKARVHLTDAIRTNTETPCAIADDGSLTIKMMANSFAVVEVPAK